MRLKLSDPTIYSGTKRKFFWQIRDRNGEPPVLFSQVDLNQNIKLIQNHLENKRVFQVNYTADTVVRRKKAHVIIMLRPGHNTRLPLFIS